MPVELDRPSPTASPPVTRLSEVLGALSYALDITEGQPVGHSARSCMIGMRIAAEIGLSDAQRSALFYSLLLKDAGCASNAARISGLFGADDHDVKRDRKLTHWPGTSASLAHVVRTAGSGASPLERARRIIEVSRSGAEGARELTETRCERGADIARMLGLPEDTAQAIRSLDELWDGRGYPAGLAGEAIPVVARVMGLAQPSKSSSSPTVPAPRWPWRETGADSGSTRSSSTRSTRWAAIGPSGRASAPRIRWPG